MVKATLWVVVLLVSVVALGPISEAAGTDPRTHTTGRTNAITVTITRNDVTLSVSGNEVTMDWQIRGTTAGVVDHLEAVIIEENRDGSKDVSDALPEFPYVSAGGFSGEFHGTGPGGSRSAWSHSMSGRIPLGEPGSTDVSNTNLRRVVACYQAYGDEAQTQWNYACVVVFGDGAGNTGSGDQTGGVAGSAGSPVTLLLVILIIIVIVFVVLAVVLTRRRKSKMGPPALQPPMQPPMQPPLPPP